MTWASHSAETFLKLLQFRSQARPPDIPLERFQQIAQMFHRCAPHGSPRDPSPPESDPGRTSAARRIFPAARRRPRPGWLKRCRGGRPPADHAATGARPAHIQSAPRCGFRHRIAGSAPPAGPSTTGRRRLAPASAVATAARARPAALPYRARRWWHGPAGAAGGAAGGAFFWARYRADRGGRRAGRSANGAAPPGNRAAPRGRRRPGVRVAAAPCRPPSGNGTQASWRHARAKAGPDPREISGLLPQPAQLRRRQQPPARRWCGTGLEAAPLPGHVALRHNAGNYRWSPTRPPRGACQQSAIPHRSRRAPAPASTASATRTPWRRYRRSGAWRSGLVITRRYPAHAAQPLWRMALQPLGVSARSASFFSLGRQRSSSAAWRMSSSFMRRYIVSARGDQMRS